MLYRTTISIFLVVALQACVSNRVGFTEPPSKQRPVKDSTHFDPDKLQDVTSFIKDKSVTTGLVVLHKGKTVYQYGKVKKLSYLASCRKSVLSMLYGKYVTDGTIDLETSIGELGIREKDSLLDIEKTASIYDLITSRSGVHHVASNGGYDKDNFQERGSVVPGEYFVYNNWDFNVAGHVLELYAKQSIYEELEEQLAIPLGFEDWKLKRQRKSGNTSKSLFKAYHMYLSTRDMAKIGQLMLNKGKWEGKQLIAEEWVNRMVAPVTPHEVLKERYGDPGEEGIHMSYGLMWWLFDSYKDLPAYKGAYSAIGYGGQYITVFPAIDVVIAHKTKLGLWRLLEWRKTGDAYYWDIMHKIIASYQSSPQP